MATAIAQRATHGAARTMPTVPRPDAMFFFDILLPQVRKPGLAPTARPLCGRFVFAFRRFRIGGPHRSRARERIQTFGFGPKPSLEIRDWDRDRPPPNGGEKLRRKLLLFRDFQGRGPETHGAPGRGPVPVETGARRQAAGLVLELAFLLAPREEVLT